MMYLMSDPQSPAQISAILSRLNGETISTLEVFGVNSLKSVAPTPDDLSGVRIEAVSINGRVVLLRTQSYIVTIDLQRTGRLVWLDSAPGGAAENGPRPTARLLLATGKGVNFTEPAKTKRIAVSIAGT